MDEVRFDRMVPAHIVARRTACNLAYLPVGSLEWHGNHMPFGTDYMTVTHIGEEAARRYGGVVFPPIYYGDIRYFLQECRSEWRNTYVKSMQVPEGYVAAFPLQAVDGPSCWACPTQPDDGPPADEPLPFPFADQERDFSRSIARVLLEIHLYGFRSIMLLPGHGPNPGYCRRAEGIYLQNVRRRSAFGPPAKTKTVFYIELAPPHEPMMGQHWLHADRWEGSVTMAAAPGTVHTELLPKDPKVIPPAFLGHPYLSETKGYNPAMKEKMKHFRYFDPRSGTTEEYGRQQVECIVKDLGPIIREFLEGKAV